MLSDTRDVTAPVAGSRCSRLLFFASPSNTDLPVINILRPGHCQVTDTEIVWDLERYPPTPLNAGLQFSTIEGLTFGG